MYRDNDRQRTFTRRALLLAGGKLALMTVLAGRLYYLQVVEASRYTTLAEENRINLRLLAPRRGRIFDRYGRPLAVNRRTYQVTLVAERAADVEQTLDDLDRILDLTAAERERILRDIGRRRKFVPVTVRDNVTWDQVTRIEVNTPELPGVAIDEGQSRDYPYGEDLAHVLGYVAAVSESDLTGDPLLTLPGFQIGKAGIEKTYETTLRGSGGRSQVEVNAVGRVIRELSRTEGEPGRDITLTLDLDLQRIASQRIAGESAAVVVMDVHSGDVRALASSPGFDPNAFTRGLSNAEWRALTANPRAPLTNKAIAGQYAPGSTFKVAVALAALERGVATPRGGVYCPGHTTLGGHRFHCWKRGGHGHVNLHEAIVQSCDVYFYEIARRLGIERIAEMSLRLGLGQTLDFDLPGEQRGLMPTREWKEATLGGAWQTGETLIAGIGQGYVLATPLQLAVMTARIANGGMAVRPRLVRAGDHQRASPPPPSLGLDPDHLARVRASMDDVVNSRRGTAHRSAITEDGMAMAGKTGTSQVRQISKAERAAGVWRNEDLPWERRDHALFIGYAPVQSPRLAVSVIIEHGGGGSKAAAPVARDLLLAAQQLQRRRLAETDGRPRRPDEPA